MANLDATKTIAATEFDATLEVAVRAHHPAAHILGVAEAAERLRLEFQRAGLPSEFQALPMRSQATLDVTPGEE